VKQSDALRIQLKDERLTVTQVMVPPL